MSGKSNTSSNRKKAGVCVYCGGQKENMSTQVRCSKCAELQKAVNRTRRNKFLQLNKCVQCGEDRIPNSQFCEKHFFQGVSWSAFRTTKHWEVLKEKFKLQSGKCIYTGEQMILGKNASLDHIIPRSICPELANSIDNIQWVTIKMNVIKNDMTEEQMELLFKAVLKRIEEKRRVEINACQGTQRSIDAAGSSNPLWGVVHN